MPLFAHDELRILARDLLVAAGLPQPRAAAMADVMVTTDLMGHRTHGIAFLPSYLDRVQSGVIAQSGEIQVISESPAHLAWHTPRLPGAWVMQEAIAALLGKLETQPVVTATIANCSHIGSLQTYLKDIGERKFLAQLMVTDPGVISVAPFGGADPVLTSNPIAAAIPTHDQPILIDQSTSLVSNAMIAGYGRRGEALPGDWILDGQGQPSRDAAVMEQDPPGTILPLGGLDFGYKGFGFGLMVEAWGLALSGHGRRTPQARGGQGVCLQIIDSAAFAGREAFLDETTELVRRCHASRPSGSQPVRLPGERAYAEHARQMAEGIEISEALAQTLRDRSKAAGITPPAAFSRAA
ncbi:Ldh family oxidoreductase [Paracoccus laeviglucosivorans]|uniref:Malate/lactate/ureidoglycolate dehydrogenase, LDH2 family n=1 Tax=Paracoccus laeviglucosivorans TaxID=1197861 RepID=A0A521FBL0_9RHOB|nr:Ldh family oxidoreductase [Paracoccus laeviglucosivorans]SMO93444.1 Malate/lactate/ureidoglycolate dehydrogenase, LDH2 family [Paracoccus laeviglucosivorans]